MGDFKHFLLNENRVYLGEKLGDILNALQELSEEAEHMGKRQIIKHADRIVSKIRRILHSSWPKKERENLKALQKVAVAIAKVVDDGGEIEEIISGAAQELQSAVSGMGTPINAMGSETGDDQKGEDKNEQEPEHKKKKKPDRAPEDEQLEKQGMPAGPQQMPPGLGQQNMPLT